MKAETVKVFDSLCKTTDFWQTPDSLKNAISRDIMPFDELYDPCPENPHEDGLDKFVPRGNDNYINPPFSFNHQLEWAKECVRRVNNCRVEMCLLQIRFDPTASHFKYMMGKCSIVWMPDKRLKYVGAKDSYNFPIALYQIQKNPPLWPVFQTLHI